MCDAPCSWRHEYELWRPFWRVRSADHYLAKRSKQRRSIVFHSEVAGGRHIPARARETERSRLAEARTDKAGVGIVGRMELKSLFIDCNDQLAPVWKRVVRAEDPPIDVNRAAFAPTELSRLLNGYDICIDDHSCLPTAMVERCDRLKHIVFLGTGAGSYMNVGELAQRGIRVHTFCH
jgi:hypothetical protein